MASTATHPPFTKGDMGKRKDHDPRKTPRINVGIPADWHAIARRLAAKRRQPVLFLLISALQREAEEEGITDLPPAPWGEEDDV